MVSPTDQTATQRQRAATHTAIIDAALAMMRESADEPISHESVAVRAGVGARTVYRHFPTRNDLTAALWVRIRDETGTRWPTSPEEITPSLRKTFRQFEAYSELTRAAIAAAANTDHPTHGSAEGRAAFRQCFATLLDQLSGADGRQLIASCVAVYSAPFWQMLRDRGLLSARAAEDAAVTAMEAIVTAFQTRARSNSQ